MATVNVRSFFTIHENGKEIYRTDDIITNQGLAYLAWLFYRKTGARTINTLRVFYHSNPYFIIPTSIAFGTGGKEQPTAEDKDLVKFYTFSIPSVNDVRYASIAKYLLQKRFAHDVEEPVRVRFLIPAVYNHEQYIMFSVDLPGFMLYKTGINEAGLYLGPVLGLGGEPYEGYEFKKRFLFSWWRVGNIIVDYCFDSFMSIRRFLTFETLPRYGKTLGRSAARYSIWIKLPSYHDPERKIEKPIPREYWQSWYSFVDSLIRYARLLLSRVTFDVDFEHGFTYSFRFYISKY